MLAQREITMRDIEQFVCAVAELTGATVYHVEVGDERIYATYELCVWDDAGSFKQKFYADYPLSSLKYGNTYRAMNAATALCADIYQWARREGRI